MKTFNWTISQCGRELSNGGITTAHWRVNAEKTVGTGDDAVTYSISSANQISLNTDNLDASTFTAFADLTETQVVGWAKAQIDANAATGDGVVCAEWEAGHDRNIAKQINPPTAVETAPWAAE